MAMRKTRRSPVGMADLSMAIGAASLWWGLWTLFRPLAWIGLGAVFVIHSLRVAVHEQTQPKERGE